VSNGSTSALQPERAGSSPAESTDTIKKMYLGKLRTFYKKICEGCGVVYYVPSEKNRKTRKFCGMECRIKYNSRTGTEGRRQLFSCAICGKEIIRTLSRVRTCDSKVFFCSSSCAGVARRIGTGLEDMQLSHYNMGKGTYRERALRNLKPVCARCGYNKYESVLEVHHIDRNRTNNVVDNLEILCPTCHREDHYLAHDGKWTRKKIVQKSTE
jgi:5-methylcytosine-specific restriction endonuclease McrA